MMSLLERTKSNFFWGGCGMNVGEWRFVVIFNLFSNVSGCHKIAEFICECPQSFDIFKRHVSKYFFFLMGGFNLTLKVKFCQKLKVRKNSSHIFCCFPKFLLRHQRTCKFEMIYKPPLWLKISTRFLLLTFDLKLGTSVQWDWDLPWWALDVLVHLPSPAEMCRFYRPGPVFFFFSVRFRCLFGNDCFIEIYLQHHVEHGWNNERLSSLSRTPFAIHYTGVLYS